MTKFKVGDKVRILKTGAIEGITAVAGTILEVTKVDTRDGTPFLLDINGGSCCTFEYELQYIEKVTEEAQPKPTKNQRITTLESQVAELQAEVEALKKAQKYVITPLTDGFIPKQRELSPNEKRKAIIDEAKAFYSDTLNEYQLSDEEVVVIGNDKERSISITIRHLFSLKPLLNGKSKCAPDDVFNADIGKAIALGRALGLDVSRFEQAVKPTEVVSGHKIRNNYSGSQKTYTSTVKSIEGNKIKYTSGSWDCIDIFERKAVITDDTEAQYA